MQSSGESHTVALKGSEIRCVIRRRKNQKYINLRITIEGEILVSAPYGVSLLKITESLRRKEGWIESNLVKVAAGRSRHDPMRSVYLNGVPYSVSAIRDPRRKRTVKISHESRAIEIRSDDTSRKHVLAILESSLEREAKRYFPIRSAELSRSTGIQYARLFIRNQKTRWGSSSGKGNISVNWRAIMLPPSVQDYLIIHELAHQVHLNHSKAFWAVVERHCPSYRTANKWLKDNSLLISLFR
jgi:hypothetical protein